MQFQVKKCLSQNCNLSLKDQQSYVNTLLLFIFLWGLGWGYIKTWFTKNIKLYTNRYHDNIYEMG